MMALMMLAIKETYPGEALVDPSPKHGDKNHAYPPGEN